MIVVVIIIIIITMTIVIIKIITGRQMCMQQKGGEACVQAILGIKKAGGWTNKQIDK